MVSEKEKSKEVIKDKTKNLNEITQEKLDDIINTEIVRRNRRGKPISVNEINLLSELQDSVLYKRKNKEW